MNFEQNLKIIKEHHGYTKGFLKPIVKKGKKVAIEDTKPLKVVEPILSIVKLDEQALMFCMIMKLPWCYDWRFFLELAHSFKASVGGIRGLMTQVK